MNAYPQQVCQAYIISIFFLFLGTGFIGLSFYSNNVLSAIIFGEFILVGLVFGFAAFGKMLGDSTGGMYALLILNVAAVESAIGMVLTLNAFRLRGSVVFNELTFLRG